MKASDRSYATKHPVRPNPRVEQRIMPPKYHDLAADSEQSGLEFWMVAT